MQSTRVSCIGCLYISKRYLKHIKFEIPLHIWQPSTSFLRYLISMVYLNRGIVLRLYIIKFFRRAFSNIFTLLSTDSCTAKIFWLEDCKIICKQTNMVVKFTDDFWYKSIKPFLHPCKDIKLMFEHSKKKNIRWPLVIYVA